MKKWLIGLVALIIALGWMQSVSFAEMKGKMGAKGPHEMSLEDKLFKKIHVIYEHQEEIGVSDEQMEQIKGIKTDLKKDLVKSEADIDVIKIDYKDALYQDEVDIDAVNKLIDQKYEVKKAKAKKVVAAYAQFKKILSKEQMEKLKDKYSEMKMMHGMKGPQKMEMTPGMKAPQKKETE
jgi:hypothetical protein